MVATTDLKVRAEAHHQQPKSAAYERYMALVKTRREMT